MKLKKIFVRLVSVVLLLLLTMVLTAPAAQAATPTEIEEAIVKGLAWLADQQQADGSWLYSGSPYPDYDVATTGLVVLKFEERAIQLGLDPFDPGEYQYAQNVIDGFDYMYEYFFEDGLGVHCMLWPDTYDTGVAMMAIAASHAPGRVIASGPLTGQTYSYALQGMMTAMANGQGTIPGIDEGGWGYTLPYTGWSDQSNAGYATLGIGFANAPTYGFNVPIPGIILPLLNSWIDMIQEDVGPYAGGAWYFPYYGYDWINIYKTGSLLQQLALVGDPVGSPRVQAAIGFIETYWGNFASVSNGGGWMGDYQAMFTMMKGLQTYDIHLLDLNGDAVPETDWFDVVSTYIYDNRIEADADHWYWQSTGGEPTYVPVINTAWALLTLEKVAPPGALSLVPSVDRNPVGTQHTVTAIYQIGGVPQEGVTINFEVIAGPNVGESGSDVTNANGEATFTYTSNGVAGTDTIKATAVDQAGAPLVSAEATKTWMVENGVPPQVPSITGWGILAAGIILAVLIPLALRRRKLSSTSG